MHLRDFDHAVFLRDHWQQRPLLIRNPWAEWRNPFTPDELAGLACEDGIESRLVHQPARAARRLENGPFGERRFAKLGKKPWTLLVQAVDQHVPEVAALIEAFRFIPNWRIDDVMVSVAGDGGGVGPHFDQYDVFLIQGLGRRRWQVGARCDADTPMLEHDELRLLADFVPTEEWVLEPGDMLYVPPRFAHDGVALGEDCMTYSVGFRAPSRGELLGAWADAAAAGLSDDDRYEDRLAASAMPANPGEITPEALAALHAMVSAALADRKQFARWFGGFATTPKYPEIDWASEEPVGAQNVADWLAQGAKFERNPASRFAFIRDGDGMMLFVDGQCHRCDSPTTAAFAEHLCAHGSFEGGPDMAKSAEVLALLAELLTAGSVGFGET